MNTVLIPSVKQMISRTGQINIKDYKLAEDFIKRIPAVKEILEEECLLEGSKDILFIEKEGLKEESYEVEILEEKIEIRASSEIGGYYGATTLLQLIQLGEGIVECCLIQDAPTLKWRGFSDDISRGQISTVENFKSIIKRLSLYKCNVYMPYIEDTFVFDSLPGFGKYSDPVPKEEWKALVEYAKFYYVKIVPIINILGHWDKNGALAKFEEYMLIEDGKKTKALDTRKPHVKKMVAQMLEEIVEVFGEHGYIHVGGDEVGEYTRLFNKQEAGDLYNEHYQFAYKELKKQKISMMLYSDMYTPIWGDYQVGINRIEEMPEDITFVYWDYGWRKRYQNIEELIKRNKKFIVSPATYTWNRFLPHFEIAFLNTKMLAQQSPKNYEGLLMSAWCDGGMTLREENWFGILCGALFAWEPKSEITYEEYVEAFYQIYYGIKIDKDRMQSLLSYDKGYGLEDWNMIQEIGCKLYAEFWKDARLPGDADLKVGVEEILENTLEDLSYFQQLEPIRNQESLEVFLFDIERFIANLKKIQLSKVGAYSTREEAMEDIPKIDALIQEVDELREKNKQLWFKSNRQSEWEFAEAKYLDLIDSLRSLARYCKVGKQLGIEKRL